MDPTFSRDEEFPQLNGKVYLDHAGSTLWAKRQMDAFATEMRTSIWANPHSRHAVSQETSHQVARVRNRILQFFNTNSSNYTVIFTSGATAAMKLTAETFNFGCPGGTFAHLREVHTSVLGMAEMARSRGAASICFEEDEIRNGQLLGPLALHGQGNLVAFPGQCNFSGRKYPLEWVKTFQDAGWKVFLDAAALVSTSPLDLTATHPDFVALSFYKIFGFPTGLGALLVLKRSEECLTKTYFGGGAVAVTVGESGFHILRSDFTQRMEDGTLPFLDIIALNHGFDALESLGGGIRAVSFRTFALAQYTALHLQQIHHSNGVPVVLVYGWTDERDCTIQGATVAFNLQNSEGGIVGFGAVENVAESFNLLLRTGCFCNTGACQKYLGLTAEDLMANFHAGHVCGDGRDLINGKPTGAVRISFGYMSTKSDADRFLTVIREIFSARNVIGDVAACSADVSGNASTDKYCLTHLFLYPVKSCPGTRVSEWPVGHEGFLYDRKCFIRNSAGTSITLKHNTQLRDIRPSVSLATHHLTLVAPGMAPLVIDLREGGQIDFSDSTTRHVPEVVDTRVCGRPVEAVDCGPHALQWLSDYLQDDMYTLMRYHGQPSASAPSFTSSAANSAPFLLLGSASLDCLVDAIPAPFTFTREELIQRMRPNLVVQTKVPFEEDRWSRFSIGQVEFKVLEKCSRCQMININGKNGQRSSEPLQSLIRLRGKEMCFGILLHQLNPIVHSDREDFELPVLRVGDILCISS